MFSVGGGRGQAWHQDCPSGESTGFNLNRLIYPEDVTLEDGGIVAVPGSHKLGRIPPGGHQDPMSGEVLLTPAAGTLILLHGHVYHRVTPNLNQRPRLSVNFRAFPVGVSADVTCVGVYRNGTVNFCDKAKQHDGTPAMKV
jgi:ectoine hydroxylase-related dioxygenase (phytanoyl-CoA dioxygenase family)